MNWMQRWYRFARADRLGRTPQQRREAAARRKTPVPGSDSPPSATATTAGGGAHRPGRVRAPAPGLPEGCYYSVHFCEGHIILDDHGRGKRVRWERPHLGELMADEAEQWLKDTTP